MFKNDINRPISGVVMVGQDDKESLEQEIKEYIVTKELRRRFSAFFDSYSQAIDQPTDSVGVWISGFFGSGKSHFLKMLSYLLSNKEVGSKRAVDFFKDKFDAPMYATAVRCANIPTESILFNIDIEGPIKKDKTAVLRVFAKVFYNHLGFYGEDLKTAKLEQFLATKGKTEAFRARFEEVNGSPWVESRSSYAFFEDDVISVLQSVLGMSETAARNWFNSEENADMSIGRLVEEISEYVDSKGKDFRLLFCVDEAGQYIGEDSDLMINLQSIVEELGRRCRGKAWVLVTSQEAIDSVVKITGDDFSKIQGRFNTNLKLTSESVDEVIQKRILEKKPEAKQLLQMIYDKEQAVLKNLFAFSTPILDIKGYADGEQFAATYPFVPYQFIIIQKALAEIRQHGNSGKHLSGGERSMLSAFQEAAQKVRDKDENALVPFSQFYDTVHTFLESPIRRVIERCQTAADNHDGLEQGDVSVLKLLYLVRYIDDIKTNIDNIAILMIDDIHTDKINLRREITDSLERLESQNYVARSGDTYAFLTDEEQDIAMDIRNTTVDNASLVASIGQTIFAEIYPARKYKLGKYDFDYDQYIDDTRISSAASGVRLRFVTVAYNSYGMTEKLLVESHENSELLVMLSGQTSYFEELALAAKIRKYSKQKAASQLSESVQRIIRDRMEQAQNLEKAAKEQIEKAIFDGMFYVNGEEVDIKRDDAKAKLDEGLKQLVESVYDKLYLVNRYYDNDADILSILNEEPQQGNLVGTGANNEYAMTEISQWLEDRHRNHIPVSMGDVQRRYRAVPYGWREIDIACLVARLVTEQKIEIRYGGAAVRLDDRNLVRYLRVKSEVDKVSVSRRIALSEDLLRKAVMFLRNWLGQMSIPEDEDGLINFVIETLEAKYGHYRQLSKEYERDGYPQAEVVTRVRDLINGILAQRRDNTALLTHLIAQQDELHENAEDMEDIETFFKSQRAIFDSGRELQRGWQSEKDFFVAEPEAAAKIGEISTILAMEKPYSRIKDLVELMQSVKAVRDVLIEQKKNEVRGIIVQCMGDIHTIASSHGEAKAESNKADARFDQYKKEAAEAESLTELGAMIHRIQSFSDDILHRIYAVLNSGSGSAGGVAKKVVSLRRVDVISPRRLTNREEIDQYVEVIRENLYRALGDNDGVQIN
jgi:hypothetical protein